MANLIIKSSADNLVLQGSDASPAITVGATGTTTFAEPATMSGTLGVTGNTTLSGTANNIGTVTAGSLAFQSMVVWRMVNTETKGDQNPLGGGGSDWELSDDTENEFYLGSATQVTEANGIFSFGSTGYWHINGGFTCSNNTDTVHNMTMKLQASNNGSGGTWTDIGVALYQSSSEGVGYGQTITCSMLIKVTDIANDKFKCYQAADPDTLTFGNGSYNFTYVSFHKLANI